MSKSAALLLALVFLSTPFIITAKPVSAADLGSWTTKASMPQVDGHVRAAVVNGKIYVMGGSINYEYDPATDSWVEKTPMPTPRHWFGLAVYQNKIFTIGGNPSNMNEVYDPSTDTWETREAMPTSRSGVVASVVDGKIHLIADDAHDIYDVAADSWTTGKAMPFPYPAWTVSSTVFDDKIYIISENATQIYDPLSDTWSLGAAPPIFASNYGVCATTGVMAPKRIYVFGGSVGFYNCTGATQVYDPKNDSWTLGAPMLTARAGFTTAVVNDVIYAIGGGGLSWGVVESLNEQYTPLGYGTPDPSYDDAPPEITLVSPENKTYCSTNVTLCFVVNEPASWIYYSLDGMGNVTVAGNATLAGLPVGGHSVAVYVWDTVGNVGASETVTFTVAEPFPVVPVAVVFIASAAAAIACLLFYFKKLKH